MMDRTVMTYGRSVRVIQKKESIVAVVLERQNRGWRENKNVEGTCAPLSIKVIKVGSFCFDLTRQGECGCSTIAMSPLGLTKPYYLGNIFLFVVAVALLKTVE
jgi:hypothetical protein